MSNHPSRRPRRLCQAAAAAATAGLVLVPLTIGVHTGASAPSDSTEPADDSAAPLPTLLPMASESERIDLGEPMFSNPIVVDNPLFPISNLHSAILLGNNEGHPIKIETTLLPEPVMIDVDGQQIAALASQFVSYEDGRIHEVAIDWYAQDDDGNVWYLGEDVFNYADGVVEDTHGTWMAGRDGAPVAMIMPADPVGGEVFRPENIEGVLIEEVTISAVDVTVEGPTGPVEGAIIAQENHALDGVYEDKWFAPSYGEFFSGVGDSLEGIAVAVPVDARNEPVPEALTSITDGAIAIADAAQADDWDTATSTLDTLSGAWAEYRGATDVPPMLVVQMDRALAALAGDRMVPAVADRNSEGAANAALDVAQAGLDLQLQFRPPVDIDRERFELWARQLVVDAGRLEAVPGFVAADVTTLEWIYDRYAHTLDAGLAGDIDAALADLRAAADDEDNAAAADGAEHLLALIAG